MEWFVERTGRGNIVVMRESGSNGYNDWLVAKGAASVESIVLHSSLGANAQRVVQSLDRAEGIFFAGGDQSRYVKFLKDSMALKSLQQAVSRGVPIGGTSAGLAILGEFIFSAFADSVTSKEALANPFHVKVTLERGFLKLPFLDHVITDSHFTARQRMGRLLTFMARISADDWDNIVRGIGIDEGAALAIDESGQGTVYASGSDFVFFLTSKGKPETCKPNQPLDFSGIEAWRVGKGETFNLTDWDSAPNRYFINVVSGAVIP